jgi:metal-sulfur cluster biosynthetic enzyme
VSLHERRPQEAPADLETAVRERLNAITDPCSVAAGAPAGLVDMGLVHDVRITHEADGIRVSVVLGVTDPTCLMAGVFVAEARRRLANLPGVTAIDVALDHETIWTPQRLDARYAVRLRDLRSRKSPCTTTVG